MSSYASSFVLLIHDKKILLVLRDDKPYIANPNTWGLIGGMPDEGETPLQTVIRETQEEVSLTLKNPTYLCEFTYGDQKEHAYVTYLTPLELASIKLGDEGQKLAFFSFDEISLLSLALPVKEFFRQHHTLVTNLLSQ